MLQLAIPGLAIGVAIALVIALVTWVVSVPLKDASLADRVWSLMIAAPALAYVALAPPDGRLTVMLVLLWAWALRLAVYITLRNRGAGEDRRYRAMRDRRGPTFWLQSLWLVFGLQGALAWVVGWPVLAASVASRPWGGLDLAGAGLAAFGIVFEAVADAQLARFKREPAHAGAVMDRGLWRYSRHPNYFGEACVWWGLGLMALSAGGWGAAWSLASPVLMTVLLLKVSGVTLLEQDLQGRKPGYRKYVLRTSAFIPWPPRGGVGR